MRKSVYVSLSDVVRKVRKLLEENNIDFKQSGTFTNVFRVPAGELRVEGIGLAPKFLLNGVKIKYSDICDSVVTQDPSVAGVNRL